MTGPASFSLIRISLIKIASWLFLFSILQGCVQHGVRIDPNLLGLPSLTLENTGSFSSRPDIPSPEQIHQLTPEQIERLLSYMNDPRYQNTARHLRFTSFLKEEMEAYTFERRTLTASQVMAFNAGNCMSLAVLTTALAEVAGLDVGYQLMDDVPVYAFSGSVVTKGVHVRTKVYDTISSPVEGTFVISRPGATIDYFPTNRQRFIANIGREDYLARYYRNIAAQAIGDESYNTAYWYAMESLKFAPDDSQAINMLAVVNRRVGDIAKAEELYLFGIEHAEEKLSLLNNYLVLLEAADRTKDAARIRNQLASMDDPSPFNWFQLASTAYADAKYIDAIRYFNKALELAPYLHEAHLGVAQANYEIGRFRNVEASLKAALDNAYRRSTRALYQAKLAALSAETNN